MLVPAALLVSTPAGADGSSCPVVVPGAGATRVLLAGDSLTQGSTGDWTWRYRLWKHLHDGGVDVDFVGPFDYLFDNLTGNAFGGHEYADPCFDQAHYALGGSTYQGLLTPPAVAPDASSGIAWAVTTFHPDVVVLLLGANDLNHGATVDEVLARAKASLDQIRSADPTATVVMPTIPTDAFLAAVPDYDTRLAALVPTWSTAQSPVVLADTLADWAGIADTWDGAHPNAMGEMHLAAAIEDAFHGIGLGGPAERPVPVVPLGPRVPPTLAAQAGDSAVTLTWVSPPGADREYLSYRDLTDGGAWVAIPGAVQGSGAAVSGLQDGHDYAFRVQAAKGTAVAADIYSNVVSAQPGATPTPTPTPTATPAPSGTPTVSVSPLPSPSTTPATSQPASPSASATSAPLVLDRVSGVRGVPGYHAVLLTWQAVGGATSYLVSWRPVGSSTAGTVQVSATDLYVDGLVAGQPYAFEVRAQGGGLVGPVTSETVATPAGTVTTAPPRPRLVGLRGHRIGVRWAASVDATRYQVQLRRAGGSWHTVGWTAATRLTTRPLARVRYAVRVQPWHQLVPGHVSPVARVRVR